MEYIKLISIVLGATGFWKLIELVLNYRQDSQKKAAEIKNLNTQSETQFIDGVLSWSQRLDARVKELESVAEENRKLVRQIETQRKRINELETKVERLVLENHELQLELRELREQKGKHNE